MSEKLDSFHQEIWSEESIFRVENHIVNNIFACRTLWTRQLPMHGSFN